MSYKTEFKAVYGQYLKTIEKLRQLENDEKVTGLDRAVMMKRAVLINFGAKCLDKSESLDKASEIVTAINRISRNALKKSKKFENLSVPSKTKKGKTWKRNKSVLLQTTLLRNMHRSCMDEFKRRRTAMKARVRDLLTEEVQETETETKPVNNTNSNQMEIGGFALDTSQSVV